MLFRNFDIKGGADRTMIYLTLHAVQCLVKCERIDDKFSALREMNILATKQFVCPGDAGWPLGGLFPAPKTKAEGGKLYLGDLMYCEELTKYQLSEISYVETSLQN